MRMITWQIEDTGHNVWGKEGISCFLYMLMHCYIIHIAFDEKKNF